MAKFEFKQGASQADVESLAVSIFMAEKSLRDGLDAVSAKMTSRSVDGVLRLVRNLHDIRLGLEGVVLDTYKAGIVQGKYQPWEMTEQAMRSRGLIE